MSTFAYLKGEGKAQSTEAEWAKPIPPFSCHSRIHFFYGSHSSPLCRPCQLVGFQCVCAKNSHPKLCFLPRPWPSKTISPTKYCLFPNSNGTTHSNGTHHPFDFSALILIQKNEPTSRCSVCACLFVISAWYINIPIFLHLMLPAFSHSLNSFHSPPTTILAQPIPSRPTGSTEKTKRWRVPLAIKTTAATFCLCSAAHSVGRHKFLPFLPLPMPTNSFHSHSILEASPSHLWELPQQIWNNCLIKKY